MAAFGKFRSRGPLSPPGPGRSRFSSYTCSIIFDRVRIWNGCGRDARPDCTGSGAASSCCFDVCFGFELRFPDLSPRVKDETRFTSLLMEDLLLDRRGAVLSAMLRNPVSVRDAKSDSCPRATKDFQRMIRRVRHRRYGNIWLC